MKGKAGSKMKIKTLLRITVLCVGGFAVNLSLGRLAVGQGDFSVGFALENGDSNGDLERDLSDVVHLLGHVFLGGPSPLPLALCGSEPTRVTNGDSNGDGAIDVSDGIHLLGWLYAGGPAPVAACGEGSAASRNENPRIIPPQARPYGKSYGEWSAAWWQWGLGFPTPNNPIVDATGEFCALGQSGPVWFLAGNVGGTTERACSVPAGKALFVPLLNVISWAPDDVPFAEFLGLPGETAEEKLLALVNLIMDQTDKLEVTVDGVPLENLIAYRAESPAFPLTFVEDNIFGVPPGERDFAISDGFWLIIAPLTHGEHDIHFTSSFACTENTCGFEFGIDLDVTYHLSVE